MKSISLFAAAFAVACALMADGAAASVTVTFTQPEKYTDMPYNAVDKQMIMDDLHKHFDQLGATLPTGQDLRIEVLDIDLAGRIEPIARASRDMRVLRGGADWPVITLRYSLESAGGVLKSGQERIADMVYLQGYNHYGAGENLRYEKQMLDRWFKKTLAPVTTGK